MASKKYRHEQEYLSATDVAKFLGVHLRTWQRLSKKEGAPPYIMVGKQAHLKRWKKEDIEHWLHDTKAHNEPELLEGEAHDADNPIIDEELPGK